MNASLCRLSWGFAVILSGIAHAQVQPAGRPASAPRAAASAASQPDAVTRSPATRATEAARTPGDLRPQQPVVPQVAVPLRRGAQPGKGASAPGATGVGKVDDSAARCRAAESAAARAGCEAKRQP